jgi:hypothetical protein
MKYEFLKAYLVLCQVDQTFNIRQLLGISIAPCQEMAGSRKAVAESGCLMYVIVRAGEMRLDSK